MLGWNVLRAVSISLAILASNGPRAEAGPAESQSTSVGKRTGSACGDYALCASKFTGLVMACAGACVSEAGVFTGGAKCYACISLLPGAVGWDYRECADNMTACGNVMFPIDTSPTPGIICDRVAKPNISCVACCKDIAKKNCSCPSGNPSGGSQQKCEQDYYGFCWTQCSGGVYGKPFKPRSTMCVEDHMP